MRILTSETNKLKTACNISAHKSREANVSPGLVSQGLIDANVEFEEVIESSSRELADICIEWFLELLLVSRCKQLIRGANGTSTAPVPVHPPE